jgi:hypothetical protein
MTLIVVTVVIIGLLIAALTIYLFMIGIVLNRIAGNLGDCLHSVRTIFGQAQVVGPGIKRLNKTGEELLGAMPLLVEGADGVAAKLAPSSDVPTLSAPASPTLTGSAARPAGGVDAPGVVRAAGGLLDSPVGVGYLDV